MNDPTTPVALQPAPQPTGPRRGRPPRDPNLPAKQPRPPLTPFRAAARASERARQVAALVLEVLSGVRTPADAAQILQVAPVRYYQLEARAMTGLLQGCEPPVRGRPGMQGSAAAPSVADLDQMKQEQRRLTNEIARLQALLRSARGALGLKPPAPPPTLTGTSKPGRGRHPRRPRVRALRMVQQVRQGAGEASTPPADQGMSITAPMGG